MSAVHAQFFLTLYATVPAAGVSIENVILVSDNAAAIPQNVSLSAKAKLPFCKTGSCRWQSTPVYGIQHSLSQLEASFEDLDDQSELSDSDSETAPSTPRSRASWPAGGSPHCAPKRPQRRSSMTHGADQPPAFPKKASSDDEMEVPNRRKQASASQRRALKAPAA